MKKISLIPEWRHGAKFLSNKILALITGINVIWALFPAQWTQGIPQEWLTWATAILAPLGIAARMVKQDIKGRDK